MKKGSGKKERITLTLDKGLAGKIKKKVYNLSKYVNDYLKKSK